MKVVSKSLWYRLKHAVLPAHIVILLFVLYTFFCICIASLDGVGLYGKVLAYIGALLVVVATQIFAAYDLWGEDADG